MNNPHINQVRQSLLDTLSDLRNKAEPMDIERAKAVAKVASVLVDTARVENEYLKLSGQDRSAFLETSSDSAPDVPRIDGPAAHNPFPTSVVHHLRG